MYEQGVNPLGNLLNVSDNRRLQLVEKLSATSAPIRLEELSEYLNASARVLKEDIAYFRKNTTDFDIRLTKQGVLLKYAENKGLKNIYQKVLSQSTAYQLLETIFLSEGKTIAELKDLLFVSRSTLYRLINVINEHISQFDFQIQTNPCVILGDEKRIRSYFYRYFYEKYSFISWPFLAIDEEIMDKFLTFHLGMTQMNNDFAYYSKFKIITTVNLIRFKNKHYVDTTDLVVDFEEALPDLTPYASLFKTFEKTFKIDYDLQAIMQIFTSYVESDFSFNYDHLMQRAAEDEEIAEEVAIIRETLDALSTENNIPIPNKEKMISAIRNIIHLDYLEPHPSHILYDRDKHFVLGIKKAFPNFYASLYSAMKEFRKALGKPQTEDGIYFYMYTIFTYWEGLISNLYLQLPEIRVVVISNRHVTHAELIKGFIEHEFSEQVKVQVFAERTLDLEQLTSLNCDLIVANFILPDLPGKRTVYIENIPLYPDLTALKKAIESIRREEISTKEGVLLGRRRSK